MRLEIPLIHPAIIEKENERRRRDDMIQPSIPVPQPMTPDIYRQPPEKKPNRGVVIIYNPGEEEDGWFPM